MPVLPHRVPRGQANPLHFKFSWRLRKARQAAGLTGSALSTSAGLDRSLVSHLEVGPGLPLLSTAEKLADALHCSAGWLCYGLASPGEPVPESRVEGLAERLRQVRQDHGLSLAEVGRRAGSSAAAVKALESGTVPTIATAEQVAKALGVSPAWLAYGEGPRELPKRGFRGAADEALRPAAS